MKRIYANTPGTFPAPTPEGRTIKVREQHGCGDDVVTGATRDHERGIENVHRKNNLQRLPHTKFAGRCWVQICKNRVAFNHETRWGTPWRADLWHAIY